MKKTLIFVCLFVCSMLFLNACGSSDEKVTGGSGLPAGWYATFESNRPPANPVWNAGTTYTYYIVIKDQNHQTVASPGYDLSSTIWWVEQISNIVTLSDTTGEFTQITANNPGQFTLHMQFKGINAYQNITIS
ncbi:MAG: hypothetical protein FWG57_04995 [Endomicrobia bacterium]|nr:hypothetical protein [Endomicrobiia bacterium]